MVIALKAFGGSSAAVGQAEILWCVLFSRGPWIVISARFIVRAWLVIAACSKSLNIAVVHFSYFVMDFDFFLDIDLNRIVPVDRPLLRDLHNPLEWCSEEEFRQHFRFTKVTTLFLIENLKDSLDQSCMRAEFRGPARPAARIIKLLFHN